MTEIEFSPERSAAIRTLLVSEVSEGSAPAERRMSRSRVVTRTGTVALIVVGIVIAGSMSSVRSVVSSMLHPAASSATSSSAGVAQGMSSSAAARGTSTGTAPHGAEAEPGSVSEGAPSLEASGVNAHGESYGPAIAGTTLPQLVAVIGRSARGAEVEGYVTRGDYVGAPVGTSVRLLRADGTTVVGTWTVSRR